MKFAKQCLAAILCTVFVVACSGGSDGGSPAAAPMPQNMAKIDAASAASIAGEVVDAVLLGRSIGGILSSGGAGSLAGNADSGLSKAHVSQPGGLPGYFAVMSLQDTNAPCAVDGNVTVTGQIADPTTLSAGDRLNLEFSDCDDGNDQVLNGIYEIVVDSFSGNLLQEVFDLEATVTFDGFEFAQGPETTALNGATTLNLDTTVPLVSSVSMSGDSLSASDGTGSVTLTGFRTDVTFDARVSPEVYTTAASGTLRSTYFDGNVNYSTPIAFEGFVGEFPYPGELLVIGASGASLKLMARDNINVRLEIDPGAGLGVTNLDTTWVGVENAVGASATGITGQVVWGPVVPGPEDPGQDDEAPFSALFHVFDSADNAVASFESDDNGIFTVLLAPGDYTIVPDESTPIPNAVQQWKSATVPENGFADVVFSFDTGMR